MNCWNQSQSTIVSTIVQHGHRIWLTVLELGKNQHCSQQPCHNWSPFLPAWDVSSLRNVFFYFWLNFDHMQLGKISCSNMCLQVASFLVYNYLENLSLPSAPIGCLSLLAAKRKTPLWWWGHIAPIRGLIIVQSYSVKL